MKTEDYCVRVVLGREVTCPGAFLWRFIDAACPFNAAGRFLFSAFNWQRGFAKARIRGRGSADSGWATEVPVGQAPN